MDFILLVVGLAMLIFGADVIVRGSVSMAKRMNISTFAIGIVIVSAGTSLPELANCIEAVISGHSDIAVGTVVGSNIANILLIMGATTIFCPVKSIVQNNINQSVVNIIIAAALIFFGLFSLYFNFIFGIVALILLIIIMMYQIKIGFVNLNNVDEKKHYSLLIAIILIIIGIILLIVGSNLFIKSAVNISNIFEIPESVIGISLVAFGTSLPELTVGVVSALRKKVDFALGNVLGSNIYNILGILGVSSFFGTFYIPTMVANFDLYVMISVTVVITLFMLLYKKLSRSYGIFSLIIYFSYIFYLYI